MKKLVSFVLFVCLVSVLFARERIASYWTVSAIVQTVEKDSTIKYAVHFYGKRYEITPLQHDSLMRGMDITLNDSVQ